MPRLNLELPQIAVSNVRSNSSQKMAVVSTALSQKIEYAPIDRVPGNEPCLRSSPAGPRGRCERRKYDVKTDDKSKGNRDRMTGLKATTLSQSNQPTNDAI